MGSSSAPPLVGGLEPAKKSATPSAVATILPQLGGATILKPDSKVTAVDPGTSPLTSQLSNPAAAEAIDDHAQRHENDSHAEENDSHQDENDSHDDENNTQVHQQGLEFSQVKSQENKAPPGESPMLVADKTDHSNSISQPTRDTSPDSQRLPSTAASPYSQPLSKDNLGKLFNTIN